MTSKVYTFTKTSFSYAAVKFAADARMKEKPVYRNIDQILLTHDEIVGTDGHRLHIAKTNLVSQGLLPGRYAVHQLKSKVEIYLKAAILDGHSEWPHYKNVIPHHGYFYNANLHNWCRNDVGICYTLARQGVCMNQTYLSALPAGRWKISYQPNSDSPIVCRKSGMTAVIMPQYSNFEFSHGCENPWVSAAAS